MASLVARPVFDGPRSFLGKLLTGGRLSTTVALLVGAPPAVAQVSVQLSATTLLIGTWVDPTPNRANLTEVRLVRPVVTAHVHWRNAFSIAAVNLEGLTIPKGELGVGVWGEGLVDRRHPHTYVHELIIGTARRWACRSRRHHCGAGLMVGKGFVAFGSDDPMARPVAKYPVNHHWAQVVERAMITGQVEVGAALLEASVFNGDEPERPGQWPRIARFGDSWSARATVSASPAVTASVSIAEVASPEHRPGAGSTHRKLHLGVRYQSPDGARYGLVEWTRTSELDGFFVFRSVLAEGAWRIGPGRPYYQFERSERPEEERLSAFRVARPHLENSILGITRWTLHTIGIDVNTGRVGRFGEVHPFAEATVGRAVEVGPGLFRVVDQYGTRTVHSLSLGVRVGWRLAGHRMGRYGLAAPAVASVDHQGGSP